MREEPKVPFPVGLIDGAMPHLTDTEWRVLCVVVRQTLGWSDPAGGRKRRDWLSHSQLRKRTGRSGGAVSLAVDALVRSGLVEATDALGCGLTTSGARRKARRVYYALARGWETRLRNSEATKEKRDKKLSTPNPESVSDLLRRWR